jgi:hypothetical protein
VVNVGRAKKPEFKKVGASTYACTACSNFNIEILKQMGAGRFQRHMDHRLAQHIRDYHSGFKTGCHTDSYEH